MDKVSKVPQLLESFVNAWPSRGAGIRVLRLVNKELSTMAMTAVQSCAVQIGKDACSNLEQVTRLMSACVLQTMLLLVRLKEVSCSFRGCALPISCTLCNIDLNAFVCVSQLSLTMSERFCE